MLSLVSLQAAAHYRRFYCFDSIIIEQAHMRLGKWEQVSFWNNVTKTTCVE